MTIEDKNEKEMIDHINWLPGHMVKAVKEIKKAAQSVNIIIEIRDARVPMASGNKEIYSDLQKKPYLIIFNKTNLANPNTIELWQKYLTEQNESFLFINALDKKAIKEITKKTRAILQKHRKETNSSASSTKDTTMLLLGLPNTGKSTIINKLSKRNASKAAATPGQTKVKLWVNADKDLKILDTPGIMPPVIKSEEHAMWLSAIHAIPDHIITPHDSATFIIDHLLKNKSEAFRDFYKLETLDIDLTSVLEHIGKKRRCLIAGGGFDYEYIYKIILNDFRKGELGLTSFEKPPTDI